MKHVGTNCKVQYCKTPSESDNFWDGDKGEWLNCVNIKLQVDPTHLRVVTWCDQRLRKVQKTMFRQALEIFLFLEKLPKSYQFVFISKRGDYILRNIVNIVNARYR